MHLLFKGKNDFSISIIAIYRNWSRNITDINGSRLVSDTTINMRLSIIKKFYEYCYKEKLINFKALGNNYKIPARRTL